MCQLFTGVQWPLSYCGVSAENSDKKSIHKLQDALQQLNTL